MIEHFDIQTITGSYVHIPFCTHKCEFCDFAAFAGLMHLEDEYCSIVVDEIEQRLASVAAPVKLSTIYYGGGTPGLVSPKNVARIHETLLRLAQAEPSMEVTLETTPHAITAEKCRQWRQLGINRLSIGIESLSDDELAAIGRDHSKAQALSGVALAQENGFDNISVDFMYGLPTQTLASWNETLEHFLALAAATPSIKHVSSYGLALADNSPLYSKFPRNSPQYPADELFADMFQLLVDKLKAAGFVHYEVSNFAKPGAFSRHNMIYWKNLPYLAFGVGAHRYVDGWRSSNWRSLKRYMREPLACELNEFIDAPTRVKEAIMLGLRMRAGIDLAEFESLYGLSLEKEFARQIERLAEGGFLTVSEGRMSLTDRGVPISNSILVEFM